ncbi:MAG: hypothetical protein ABI194_02860 [Gemmatimonadaceae bacterium]
MTEEADWADEGSAAGATSGAGAVADIDTAELETTSVAAAGD